MKNHHQNAFLTSPCRLLLLLLFSVMVLGLSACNTAGQPNYAKAYHAKNQKSAIREREFSLTPASPSDGLLAIEMLSINEDGELLLRTQFGIEKYRKNDKKLLNGQYIVLLDVDASSQQARLKTWTKPVF